MQAVAVAASIARKRVLTPARFEKVSCLNRSTAARNTAMAAQRSARIGEYCFDMILKPKGGTLARGIVDFPKGHASVLFIRSHY